jgi:uncharacterized membrane protein YccC
MTIPKDKKLENITEQNNQSRLDKLNLASEEIRTAFDNAMQPIQANFVERRKKKLNSNPFNKGVSALGDRRKARPIHPDTSHHAIIEGVID